MQQPNNGILSELSNRTNKQINQKLGSSLFLL
jgi:hypothetical protein